MSRTFLFDFIRAHLKARGHTYRQLAEAIGVSEPIVKRIFATNDCTIERLEEICQFLYIELAQLVKSTPKKRKLIEQIKTSTGKVLASTDVDKLVQAMAGLTPLAAGTSVLLTNYQTALAPVIAANWH